MVAKKKGNNAPATRYKAFEFHTCTKCLWKNAHTFSHANQTRHKHDANERQTRCKRDLNAFFGNLFYGFL